MYIGGISYFSSGSGKRALGGVCPEAAASPDSKTNQIKKRVLDTIKHLRLKKGDRISEHTRGVHQILSTQTGHANASTPANSVHKCQMLPVLERD
jgi:hypothetical protein